VKQMTPDHLISRSASLGDLVGIIPQKLIVKEYLRRNPKANGLQISEATGINYASVRTCLRRLRMEARHG